MSNLALSETSRDHLIETMLGQDGCLSPFAYQNYPEISGQDALSYHYIGLEAAYAKREIARRLTLTGKSTSGEGKETIGNRKIDAYSDDLIKTHSESRGKNKPEIIAILGKIIPAYGCIQIDPADDYQPPYGGNSHHVTSYQRGED